MSAPNNNYGMRQNNSGGRRSRGRHHGGGGGGHSGGHDRANSGGGSTGNPGPRDNRPRSASSLRHQTFDSNCVDVRVRGNAWQVHEKYQSLARDAQSGGDRVSAEHYLQHAEHYYRIIEAINDATAAEQRARGITPTAPTFGQQPDMPVNYYGADGAQQPPAPGIDGQPQPAVGAPPVQAEAHVQPRVQPQPQQQNPFFTPEEMEEQADQAVAARR